MRIKNHMVSVCSAAALSAGVLALTAPAQAADAVIAVPKHGATVEAADGLLAGTTRDKAKALVVQKGFDRDQDEVVVVSPEGNRSRVQVKYQSDGSVVIPLDGETALLPPTSVEPTEYSREAYNIYRVYDCATMNTQFEWDACEGPKTQ